MHPIAIKILFRAKAFRYVLTTFMISKAKAFRSLASRLFACRFFRTFHSLFVVS